MVVEEAEEVKEGVEETVEEREVVEVVEDCREGGERC